MDPPRPESSIAVARCLAAGITPVMITGDHPGTAKAIAVKLGIASGNDLVMTGAELESLDDRRLSNALESVRVFARVTPTQKKRLIHALQGRGEGN